MPWKEPPNHGPKNRIVIGIDDDDQLPEKRSEVMSRICGRDTKPELALRSMRHPLGYEIG